MSCKFVVAVCILLLVVSLGLTGCRDRQQQVVSSKPIVVTTLFPVYDFARSIAAGRMEVQLMLPPGVEPHHFEPRPDDIARLQRASLLIYTSDIMEPWVARLRVNPDLKQLQVVQAAGRISMMETEAQGHGGHDHQREEHRLDPHVWLDFDNARAMVDEVASGMAAKDPANAATYRSNAESLKAALSGLDARYRTGLIACKSRILLHGGHATFGYLARRYVLTYRAAIGVNADAEPSPRQLAELVKQIKGSGLQAVYTEELVSPRLAQTLASETGAQVLTLNGAHNLTREQFNQGVTFVGLMDGNLKNLQQGLGCAN